MLRFTNSLTRTKEAFKPLKRGVVSVYNCGPTVYGFVHIGNLRYFVFTDLLRRFLESEGLEVRQVMNITDVGHMLADADEGEDKMDVAAKKEGKSPEEVAKFYTEAFFKDIDRLNIRRAMNYPRASEHVPEMIATIERLLANGHAYKVGGNVYYDVSSFPKYGVLSGNTVEGLQPGARIDVRTEKKNPADFALWIENAKHLAQWEAPWGKGYPGWHIECSAMAMKYLGETIDIHTGGEDNKFPHHECEIAQSEGATRKPFARFWLHATHLLVDGEKMSKSKGNVYTLDDLVGKGYKPREVRYLLISTHYRQPLNFTEHGLESARGALGRIDAFADALHTAQPKEGKGSKLSASVRKQIKTALEDDLNVAEALSAFFEYVRVINEKIALGSLTVAERDGAYEALASMSDVFGFVFGTLVPEADVPASIRELIARRDDARKEKRFSEADRLRDELLAQGYSVEDTPSGRRIKRV